MKPGAFRTVAAVVAVLAAAPAAGIAPELSFDDGAVVVSSLPPGGSVALLGVSRWPGQYRYRIEVIDAVLVDDDGDGRVRWAAPAGLAERSAFAVVELMGGEAAVGAPAGSPAAPLAPAPAVLEAGAGALLDARRFLAVLVVRPGGGEGSGAWYGMATDGGGLDADGVGDGALRVEPSALAPVGGGAGQLTAPAAFAAGDRVVGIDGETLGYFTLTPGDAPGSATGGAR